MQVLVPPFTRVLAFPLLIRKNPENEVLLCGNLSCENERLPIQLFGVSDTSVPTSVCHVKAP